MNIIITICLLIVAAWIVYIGKLYFNGKCFSDEKDDTLPGCLGGFLMLGTLGAGAMLSFMIGDKYGKLATLIGLATTVALITITANIRRVK